MENKLGTLPGEQCYFLAKPLFKEGWAIATIWIVSMIALWVIVLFETVLLLLMLRALGALRQQWSSPAMNPAINDGPEIGV